MMAFLVGGLTGILSACGLGGGTLLLLYLVEVVGMELHLAQGINLIFFLPVGIMAVPAHKKGGYFQKEVILPCVMMGVITAGLGVYLGTLLDPQVVRKLFGGFLILLGIAVFRQEETPFKE